MEAASMTKIDEWDDPNRCPVCSGALSMGRPPRGTEITCPGCSTTMTWTGLQIGPLPRREGWLPSANLKARREGLNQLTRMTEEFGGYDAERAEAARDDSKR